MTTDQFIKKMQKVGARQESIDWVRSYAKSQPKKEWLKNFQWGRFVERLLDGLVLLLLAHLIF